MIFKLLQNISYCNNELNLMIIVNSNLQLKFCIVTSIIMSPLRGFDCVCADSIIMSPLRGLV